MNKTFEELRQRRLKWTEANRLNNFEEGIKRLLTDLYPDNAHFIYELLQNAEDQQASDVKFSLAGDLLKFEHNGARTFDIRDVDSITNIGSSTKRDDNTKIGKFGVGFKAVFAYTSAPEIHSGEFHFRIHDLVVPERITSNSNENSGTVFVFPFNHPTKRRSEAVKEVERALKSLGNNTLLFLSHIREIQYTLPDGSRGYIQRKAQEDGSIEIKSQHAGTASGISNWFRFQRDVHVTDEDNKKRLCRIAIAFQLTKSKQKSKNLSKWSIVPIEHGQVSIYFPAAKETSNLHFHIHAPFASTVARDSVRECDANYELRDHLANLVAESLVEVRDKGMLTTAFLSVMPNPSDNLSSFYDPIRERIVEEFQSAEITPTRAGGHAAASCLFRGPEKIAEIISDQCLSLLTNFEPPLWAANPTEQNKREDDFLDSLEMDSWSWDELSNSLETLEGDSLTLFEEWIASKNDSWIMRFYTLLDEAYFESSVSLNVEHIRIVRVSSGDGVDHVLPNEAFFAPEENIKAANSIQFVKHDVYNKGRSEALKSSCVSFLQRAGVRAYDAKTVVELILGNYGTWYDILGSEKKIPPGHFGDIKQIVSYWKKNQGQIDIFDRAFILGGSNAALFWCSPRYLCLDAPYEETGLSELFKIHKRRAIWEGYLEKLPKSIISDFINFLKSIKVMHQLEVSTTSSLYNPHTKDLRRDYYTVGTRMTNTFIDEDYTIENIESYVSEHSVLAGRLIWNALIRASRKAVTAHFRPNQNYVTREAPSSLVCYLKSRAWIPDREGAFRKPDDMTKDDLRTDFPFDDRNGLLTAIGFGENAKKRSEEHRARNEAAKKIGFQSEEEATEIAQFLRETKLSIGEIRLLASGRQKVSQPEECVQNPERRRKGILERRENAPARESIRRERSIQPFAKPEVLEAKAYLRAKYTNADRKLICQCCHEEMPFKIGDDYYFEAVQCLRGLEKHIFENRLSLCPICAAMYQYARQTEDGEIRRSIVEHTGGNTASSAEITIRLAGRVSQLRFVGTHWFDLQTILKSD